MRSCSRALPIVLLLGCASADASFAEGQRAFSSGAWQRAIDTLQDFSRESCPSTATDARCKQAALDSAESRLRLGSPKEAYFAAESARSREPHGGALDARLDRLQIEARAAFASGTARPPGQARLSIRFASQPSETFALRFVKFLVDLDPIPTDNSIPYVAGKVALAVPPTSIPAGKHELQVMALYESGPRLPAGYRFAVRADHAFDLAPGAATEIEVRINDEPAKPVVDRLTVDFVSPPRRPEAPPPPVSH